MNPKDWVADIVSLLVGLLLALTIGGASHWAAGLAVLLVWIGLHGLTWGFRADATVRRKRKFIQESRA